MFLGDNVVAHVYSFSNPLKDDPYLIKREGRPKTAGGTGYKWRCSCPASIYRKGTCKHIRMVLDLAAAKAFALNDKVTLSDFGKQLFQVEPDIA